MKQETSKNNKKWLLPVIIGAAVLVVAAIVLAIFLMPGNEQEGGVVQSKLYWNADRQENLDPETGLSARAADANGLYTIRFVVDGEHVQLQCADKRLVNAIDGQDLMGLVLNADGLIAEVLDPSAVATELAKSFFVKSFDGTNLVVNSSMAMSGQELTIPVTENTKIYDMTSKAEVLGQPGELGVMDKISVYGNEAGETTHIFKIGVPVESEIYLRVDRFYNKTTKETSRVPDENGAYTITFACKGEQVQLKCKNKNVVTQIDKAYDGGLHMGLVFDEEGYIIKTVTAGEALKGKLRHKKVTVTAIEGNTISVESKYYANTDIGETAQIVLPEGIEMYMMENGCDADYIGEPTNELKVGDRIYVYMDFEGNPLMIFVEMRRVDSPMYYNTSVQYDKEKQETTRVPENGYYVYEMAVGGKLKTYKTKNKEIANKIDAVANGCMGLKLNGSIIEDVYGSGCVCGYGTASNRMVTDIMSGIVRLVTVDDWTTGNNYMLAPDAEIYDITNNCKVPIGSVTELSPYDIVSVTFLNENNQITHMYIRQRYIEGGVLVYHTDRQYNSTTKETARVPDADGYYVFEMMGNGKLMKIKTKDKVIADYIDYNKYPVTVKLSGDLIKGVYSPASCMKGGKVTLTGVTFQSMNANGTYNYLARNTLEPGTIRYPIADDCKTYNYGAVFQKYRGEKTTPRKGDLMYNVVSFEDNKIHIMLVIGGRESDEPIYWHVNRQWNASLQETTREPDADGWYIFEFAVGGQVKTFKTKDKTVANKADRRSGAFSIIRDGDIIIDVITYPNVKGVAAVTANGYTVTEINGNNITATGSDVLKLKMAKGCYIYDISSNAKSFGAVAELAVGDVIYCLTNDDGDLAYIYITSKYKESIAFEFDGNAVNNDNLVFAEGTTDAQCPVCNTVATWTAVTTEADITEAGHYYLTNDIEVTDANGLKVLTDGVVCLHLNGCNITNNTETTGQSALSCAGGVMNVMGNGTVHTKNKTKTGGAGAVLADCAGTTVNLCGGTYTNTKHDQSALGTKGGAIMKVYKGATVSSGNMGINGDSTLEIYGGTFNSYFRAGTAGVGTLIVKDGSFTSPTDYLFPVQPATATITGGIFNVNPTTWVPEGCPVANNGLVWSVGDSIGNEPGVDQPGDEEPEAPFDPATTICKHCGVFPEGGWEEWAPSENTSYTLGVADQHKHYYLSVDGWEMSRDNKSAALIIANGSVCLHLNGNGFASTGGKPAVSIQSDLNIMGSGTISGNLYGVAIAAKVEANFYGGTVNVPDTTGYALNIGTSGGKYVVHDGATISGAKIYLRGRNSNFAELEVKGGTINAPIVPYDAASPVSISITGGTFNYNPDASYIGVGCEVTDNGDGTWTVKQPAGSTLPEQLGTTCHMCGAENVTWIPVTAPTSTTGFAASGHYYLARSISSDAGVKNTFVVKNGYNVCLDLNGQNVENTFVEKNGSAFLVQDGTLHITGNEASTVSVVSAGEKYGAVSVMTGAAYISGGNYTAPAGRPAAIVHPSYTTSSMEISGGTFSSDPSVYVNAETHKVTQTEETYTVAQKNA